MKKENLSLDVLGNEISIISKGEIDYISLTDMVSNIDKGYILIEKWLRNKNTIEFLGEWENLYNPNFNSPEFGGIRNEAGSNRFLLSVKQWILKTNAKGIFATKGRYGGTYAEIDIALEFASWISPKFKLYLIKEFRRLKEIENSSDLDWSFKRTLSKINYEIHTNAIRENLIPPMISKFLEKQIYATEADILNLALFGLTFKEWKIKNPNLEGNIRDYASVSQLICLVNLQNINSILIKEGMGKQLRLIKLNEIAISQMKILNSKSNLIKI